MCTEIGCERAAQQQFRWLIVGARFWGELLQAARGTAFRDLAIRRNESSI
jgi:hypothetical protein